MHGRYMRHVGPANIYRNVKRNYHLQELIVCWWEGFIEMVLK